MRDDPIENLWSGHFATQYDDITYGNSLAAQVMRRSHRLLEAPFGPEARFDRVLEVGAGSGTHLPFVRHSFDEYVVTDGSASMLARIVTPPHLAGKVRSEVQDAAQLSFPDRSFDRLIAAHILEHVERPHRVLREWVRVLRPGGKLSIVLPCDPGILWRLGRNFGPRRRARAAGVSYDYLMAREHINPIYNLVAFIEHYFEDVRSIWWPSRLPLADINLIYVANISI
jgi:phosphatidylethanolamine/phosphatidyl-N-methylethanolamine N-methyltransferase